MRNTITLTLQAEIVDEFLCYLHDGVEVWMDTIEYLASGSSIAPCVTAECSNIKKAWRMMRLYTDTISTIKKAVKPQQNHNTNN
jgi:hypothetical protein